MWRSIGAVVAGFLTTVVMAFGAQFAMLVLFHREPVNDSDREPTLLVILLLTTNASAAIGGYVAGYIAGRRALLHASILGLIQLLGTVALTITYWRNEALWYHVGALAFVLPATVVGGWMCARQQAVA